MITDDELLLYYYRELDPAERARIGAALGESPELAQRLHKLVARLDAAAATPEVDVPAETQQRWMAALDAAVAREKISTPVATANRFTTSKWLAAAAVVLVALGLVVQLDRQPQPLEAHAPPAPLSVAHAPGSAYERGLQTHLASTERQLASLESASPEERARLVQSIIDQNRIYALAADKAGEPQLARVLRAFSPVLESVAQGNNQETADNVSQLAFELRAIQGRLAASSVSPNPTTTL
jgi:hypothetical protein